MSTPKLPTDPLFRLERRIAQRADALTRQFGIHPGSALDHWRQAEREIWDDGDVFARVGAAEEWARRD